MTATGATNLIAHTRIAAGWAIVLFRVMQGVVILAPTSTYTAPPFGSVMRDLEAALCSGGGCTGMPGCVARRE